MIHKSVVSTMLNNENQTPKNNGLLTIYLYDSYLKGSLTKLEVFGGHTNLTGQNGAGKTSALNLIPVFYGARPDRMMDRSANKLNFTDYYLPHDRSLLIYEYATPLGINCAVFYRHPTQERLCTRFIQGAAEKTLLTQENLQFHAENNSAKELFSHLYKQGVNVSLQIEHTKDYKAVITNERFRLKANPKLRELAVLFSLAGQKLEIKHVGDLTQITSNKLNLLDSFKQMLIDLYLDSERSVTKFKISHDFAEVTNELRVLYRLQKEKPKIQAGIERRTVLLNTYEELSAYQSHVQTWKINNEDQIHLFETNLADLKQKLQRDVAELNQKIAVNSTELASIEGKLTASQAHLKRIVDTETFYKQNNILKKQQEFHHLATHEQNMLDAKNYLSELEQNYQDVKNKFSQLELEILKQKDRDVGRNTETLEQLANEKEQLSIKQKQRMDELLQAKHAEDLDFNQSHEKQRSEFEAKITRCTTRIETVMRMEANEEQEDSAYRVDIDLKNIKIQNKDKEIKQYYQNQSVLRDEYEHLREELRLEKQRLQQLEAEKKSLIELIESNDTILHFLNQNPDVNWREHIAKVIHPKLLARKDLSPYWDLELDGFGSFYGLNLDLDQLSLPQEADSLDIQTARLAEVSLNIDELHKTVQSLEIAFNKLHKKRHDAELHTIQLNTELNALKSELESLHIEYQSFKDRLQLAIQERKQVAEDFLRTTQRQYEEFKRTVEQERQAINVRFLQERQRTEDAIQDEKNILTEQQIALKQQNLKIQEDCQRKLEDLSVMYESELQQRGFDVQVQRNAKQRFEQLRDEYERIKNYRDELQKYAQWLENEYRLKDYLSEQISAYEKELYRVNLQKQKLKDKLESVNQLAQHDSQKISATIRSVEAENKKLTALASMLDQLFGDVEAIEINTTVDVAKPVNFEMLCRYTEDLISRRAQQYKELKQSVYVIMSIIRQDTDLELYKLWKSRIDRYGALTGVAYDLQSMFEIEEMLYHDIPSREALIRAQFCLKAYSLRDYAEAVLSFNAKLNKVSKDLNYKTNSTNPFPALTEIETKLVSVLDGLDVYEQLKSYVRELQESNLEDSTLLPSERLIESYERTYTALESAKVDTNDIQTLVRLRIGYKENGRTVVVNNDSDLAQGSSTGLSRLIIIIIFTALTRDMCPDLNTAIHMPLDEIGQFDTQNTTRLFQLMQDQNIHLICAQPGLTAELSKRFKHKHDIDRNFGIRRFVVQKSLLANPLLAHESTQNNEPTPVAEVE